MISTQIQNLSLDDITCLFGQWLPNNIWTSKKTSTVAVASLNKTITPLVWKLCSGQRNETISAVADKGNATFPVGSSLVWTQRGCSWTGSWCQDTRYKHTMSTGIQEYGINTNTNLNVLESDSNGSLFFFLERLWLGLKPPGLGYTAVTLYSLSTFTCQSGNNTCSFYASAQFAKNQNTCSSVRMMDERLEKAAWFSTAPHLSRHRAALGQLCGAGQLQRH